MTGRPGTRATAADIARSLGVSRATVGFVLNKTPGQAISEPTRQRVLAEADRLGYRPNHAAQSLASGRSRIILLVLPDWPMQFNTYQALEAACEVLDQAGYSPVVYTHHAADRARPLWKLLNPEVVIGFGLFTHDDMASMRACGISKILPDPARRVTLGATVMNIGPQLQVRHLSERGHRRLAVATSPEPRLSFVAESRLAAVHAEAAQCGLSVHDVRSVDNRDGSADRAVHEWHDAGVTGVVAFDDQIAACVVGTAIRAGLAVPDELAVIGLGDSPLAGLFVPMISTVEVDYEGLARRLADMAVCEADGRRTPPDTFEVHATAVHRGTT